MTQAVSIMRSDSGMDGKDKCCCKNKYRDKMLKIVRGNDFTLNLALTRQSGADRYDSYDLTGWTPSVKIINSKTKEETIATFTVSDNIISVPVDGDLLEVGTYDIEVVMVNGEQDARSYACKQFAIVETNAEAYLPRWVEFGDYDSSIIHMPMLVQVGLSAYEIALKHGFSGSEEEWLASLKGEQGEQGIQGVKGDTGATGPANTLSIGTVVSGASASASISGTAPNQTLNLVLPKGEDGQDGSPGITAEDVVDIQEVEAALANVVLRKTEQTLTESEQEQVKTNLGILDYVPMLQMAVAALGQHWEIDRSRGSSVTFSLKDSNDDIIRSATYNEVGVKLANGAMILFPTDLSSNTSYTLATRSDLTLSGPTTDRPSSPAVGTSYFDTTLGQPIWYEGSMWVDANGDMV